MENSTYLAKMIDLCEKIREDMTKHQMCLRGKLLWTKLLSEIHQISANQPLELMRVNSIPMQYVKICQQVCTNDGNLIPICKNSKLVITNLAIWRTCSCLTTKKKTECRIESFHASGSQKKIDCFNVDGYCDHCKTVFEAMGCYNLFCPAKRPVPP